LRINRLLLAMKIVYTIVKSNLYWKKRCVSSARKLVPGKL